MVNKIFSNQLLDMLPDEEIKRLSSSIEMVDLVEGEVLFGPTDEMHYMYFPVDATLSLLHSAENGPLGGIAVIGKEGMAGVCFNLTDTPALPYTAVVQIPGKCYRLSSDDLISSFKRSTDVLLIILRYSQALLSQMAQTALCNWSHPIEQRLVRWLLLSNEVSAKNEIVASKDLLAKVLNVPLEKIVAAIMKLEGLNLIHYSKDTFHLADKNKLESSACPCYLIVKHDYQRLLPTL